MYLVFRHQLARSVGVRAVRQWLGLLPELRYCSSYLPGDNGGSGLFSLNVTAHGIDLLIPLVMVSPATATANYDENA